MTWSELGSDSGQKPISGTADERLILVDGPGEKLCEGFQMGSAKGFAIPCAHKEAS